MRQVALLLAVLLFSSAAGANVIFPAFTAPYVAGIFFPHAIIIALLVEGAVYRVVCKSLSIGVICALVLAVNATSWIAGVLLTGLLPSGNVISEQGIVTAGPNFMLYAKAGFLVAYILSVIIEYGALKIATYKVAIENPLKVSILSNTASYIVLAIIVWASMASASSG